MFAYIGGSVNKKRFVYATIGAALVPILLALFLDWSKYFPDLSLFRQGTSYNWGLFFSLIIGQALYAILFVYLFVKTYRSWGEGILAGVKFGLILALLYTFPYFVTSIITLDSSVVKDIPVFDLFISGTKNFIVNLLPWVFRGIVVGIIYKE